MKKNAVIPSLILIFLIISTTGCFDFLNDVGSTMYEKHPTKIRVTLSYGYNVSCTGSGEYNIKYNCDDPEVLNGRILSLIVLITTPYITPLYYPILRRNTHASYLVSIHLSRALSLFHSNQKSNYCHTSDASSIGTTHRPNRRFHQVFLPVSPFMVKECSHFPHRQVL